MAGLKFDSLADIGNPEAYRQQPQQRKQKDFLTDQISTVGGIIGGIAGLPFGLIGAGGGAAAGSGLGEAIENIITGEDIGKNVAQETLLGGVFGAGPIKLGKALVTGGRSGAGQAVEQAAQQVVSEGGQQTTAPILKTSTQGKLQDLGNKALLSQYGTVSAPISRATNPTKTVGELADFGITAPEDAERIAGMITGSGGILNRAVARSVDKAGGVDTTNLRRIAEDALQLNGVVEKDAKSVLSVVDAQLRRLQGGPAGSLNPLANPNDALDVMKALERRIADLTGKGGNARLVTDERADQAKVLQALHDEIEDRLYIGAGANKNISKVLTPEVRNELLNLRPGDARWQSFVDNIMSSRTIEDLRAAQAPFVRVNRIIEDADQNALTFGGRGGNLANSLSASGITGAVTGAAANAAQPFLARFAGQGLRNIANRAPGAPTVSAPRPMRPLGVAARVGVGAPLASQAVDVLQGDLAPQQPSSLESALMQVQEPGSSQQVSPYSRENLIADIERDPKNASEYIKQYQSLQEIFTPKTGKLSGTQQETANRAQNALNDLSILGQAIESGELLKTAVPFSDNAFIGSALGTNDIQAALYNIGDVILRARTGAQAPESEVRAFVSGFLPRAGESKETQIYKLQRAYRELAGMANPATSSDSLADAVLAAQR